MSILSAIQATTEKCEWGSSTCVFRNDSTEIVKVEISADWHSSIHLHHHKTNAFIVESGTLWVFERNNFGTWRSHILQRNMPPIVVRADCRHMFWANGGPVVAWEIYQAIDGHQIEEGDIERFSVRGFGTPDFRISE